jgi:dihydrofolate reductase
MAKLVYSMLTSLDGFTADEHGDIGWGAPDPEVHQFVNDLERGIGTYLFGRRMYETMLYWESFETTDDQPVVAVDFANLWTAASKVVFSRTLQETASANTRLEREFDLGEVRRMKEEATADLSIGGPDLAGQALAVGLVDEVHLFVVPVTIGGGTPALPGHLRTDLELLDLDRFAGGVVHLHYRPGS